MMTESAIDYAVRPYKPEDETQLLDLLRVCLPSETSQWDTPKLWRWKHQDSPFGASYVLVAEAPDGEIIGLRALMRWEFRANDQIVTAIRPVDTATHPGYRRYGIFGNLTRSALETLQTDGVNLVFNTPNSQSLPGYIKMGWSSIGTLHPQLKLVHPVKAAAKFAFHQARQRMGGGSSLNGRISGLPLVGDLLRQPGLEALIRQDAQLNPRQLCTEKSLDYLRWRYAEHVSLRYFGVSRERQGRIEGCLVLRPYERHGLRGLIMEEMLLSEPDPDLAAGLVREACRMSSCELMMAHFAPASVQSQVLAKAGFRPNRRRNTNVVARVLNPVLDLNPEETESWGLSMGDLEFL